MKCPRCLHEENTVCREGMEDGRKVWTLYLCPACDFIWRDSEPPATLDPELRPRPFQVDPSRLDNIEVLLPPPKR